MAVAGSSSADSDSAAVLAAAACFSAAREQRLLRHRCHCGTDCGSANLVTCIIHVSVINNLHNSGISGNFNMFSSLGTMA